MKNIVFSISGFVLICAACAWIPAGAQGDFGKLSAKQRIAVAEKEQVEAATDMGFQDKMQEGHDYFKDRHYLKAIRSYEDAQRKRPYNVYPKVIIADIELSMKDTLAILREVEKQELAQTKPTTEPPKVEPEPAKDDTLKRLDDWEKKEREKREKEREKKTPPPAPEPTKGDVPRMSVEDFRKELGTQYPSGITEEVTTEGNKVITRRIVVREGKGDEYRKVEHSWGGLFFFKNGDAVPERVWKQETER